MQGGIHPDLTLEEYGKWLRLAKQVAPELHLHAYSPMEVHYMCERSGKPPDEVFEYLLECGLGSTRAPRPRSSTTAFASGSRRTSSRSTAGSRSSRHPTGPACARPRP